MSMQRKIVRDSKFGYVSCEAAIQYNVYIQMDQDKIAEKKFAMLFLSGRIKIMWSKRCIENPSNRAYFQALIITDTNCIALQ